MQRKVFGFVACGCLLFTGAFVGLSFAHQNGIKKAHMVGCANNLRQIGLALAEYAQDNDGMLPAGERPSRKATWQTEIWPYTKSKNCFRCPSRSASRVGNGAFPVSYAANTAGAIDGAANRGLFAPSVKPLNINHVPSPSETIAICEVQGNAGPGFDIDNPAFGPDRQSLYAGHDHRSVYLFLDGHVEAWWPHQTVQGEDYNGAPNHWYLNGKQPLSDNGTRILAQTEKAFANTNDENTDND